MKIKKEKLCSFFISKWHMITILLPFLSNEVKKESEIIIITKEKFFDNIRKIKEKVNVYDVEKILEYEEKEFNKVNLKLILEKIKKYNEENNIKDNSKKNINIVIAGTIEYVESVNNDLEELINIFEDIYIKIKIINCYDLNKYDGGLEEILERHDKQLNTSGERKIENIYEIYRNKKIIVVNGNS